MPTIVLEVPEELNQMVPALRDLLGAAQAQIEVGRSGDSVDYATFEKLLAAKFAAVECRAHEAVLTALDVDAPRVLINGVPHTRAVRSQKTFMSMAGPVRAPRTLYRPLGSRNAKTVDPVALRIGAIGDGWLPATAREMAFAVQQSTPRDAATTAQRLGRLPYSYSAFHTVAHAVGAKYLSKHQEIEQILIESFEVPEAARSVSVSLDRVALPMEEPSDRPIVPGGPKRPINRVFRMAYCGTATLHDEHGEAIHTLRYGTMPDGDPDALCMGMADDVAAMLMKRPDLTLVQLCDGAKEMWTLLDAQFKAAPFDRLVKPVTRLIDFWHVIEKLAAAAKVLVGAHEARALIARWKPLLRDDSEARAAILGELVASQKEFVCVGDKQPVHDAITYLTNNAGRMDYAAARAAHLPIGSGGVEAACKSLVGVRMKRSGSRWKSRTGEHVIQLRALALSDRWDQAMDHTITRTDVAVRRAA